ILSARIQKVSPSSKQSCCYHGPYLRSLASGFRQKDDYDIFNKTFIPCPLGTFTDPSTKGENGCKECPPGNF
ncbi:hypothetical protein OS493_002669, partial [Desmophyllum pertusum]